MESAHAPVARITPAHAGKRAATGDVKPAARDHPRACREKSSGLPACLRIMGSPPRVRGKDAQKIASGRGPGITPARAGKRSRSISETVASWDHPRACGEKMNYSLTDAFNQGSPPRVRGKEEYRPYRVYPAGITPARAGKRVDHTNRHCAGRDHPRACGEKGSHG